MLTDFPLAVPGIVAPADTVVRADDADTRTASLTGGKAAATALPADGAFSGFVDNAFRDFLANTGYVPAKPADPVADDGAPDEEGPVPDDDDAREDGGAVGGAPLPPATNSSAAEAGRVKTITLDDVADIASVRVLSQAANGHVSVNADKSLSLVLSENPGNTSDTSFSYEITFRNGTTQEVAAKVDVTRGAEIKGWGQGDFFMLETGADGRVVVEHGDNHRKIHITEGAHGLTRAEIARAEGIAEKKVTAKWLLENPEYGATPDKALATGLGMDLWYASTDRKAAPTSNWLLLERGYDYGDTGRLIGRGASGESALNPLYVGAYGDGTDPVLEERPFVFQNKSSHVVIQDLDMKGFRALSAENLLLDNVSLSGAETAVQSGSGFTLRDSDITDVAHLKPMNAGSAWASGPNKIQGVYIAGIDGALFEGNLFDRNGWAEGFAQNMSVRAAMPPSKFNHNLYVQSGNTDVTLRDNIFMRGASFGAQLRPGGVVEDNLFLDNNAALNLFDGGNYSLLLGNVVTSAGYKQVKDIGAVSMGIDNHGPRNTLIDNIIAHLADPANPAEKAVKTIVHRAISDLGGVANDTIIYNWTESRKPGDRSIDRNVDGMNASVLDETTIQNFTADLLGKDSATIGDLADYLRDQAAGKLDGSVDADIINAFFQEGFGLDTALRSRAAVVRFDPDDRAEGMRWDNRLNWSTDDLPGTKKGDSVDLGGNRVMFSTDTASVDDFIFGDFGQLKATGGKLTVTGNVSTGNAGSLLQIDKAGQVWLDGYRDADTLTVELTGGRLANTGTFVGAARIGVAEDAQLLLATAGARFDLAGNSGLVVAGSNAEVGFDGASGKGATLQFHDNATLAFAGDKGGVSTIAEFHSGAFETSNVLSGVRLDGNLVVDLSGMNAKAGGTWTLMDVDQMIGSFDDIAISGLGSKQDALLRYDYTTDELVLAVSAAGKGSGQVRTGESGDERFIDYSKDAALKALWSALQAPMPAATDDPI